MMRIAMVCACLVVGFARPGRGQDAISPPDAFGHELAVALRSGDFDRFVAMLHSRTRACLTPQTRPYYVALFDRQARWATSDSANVRVTAFAPDSAPLSDGLSAYPVPPTHALQLDFVASRRGVLVVLVAPDGGRWRQVLACPSPAAVTRLLSSLAADSALAARARTLADGLPASVRMTIERLARAGRRIDATNYCLRACPADLALAKHVVDLLVPPHQP